MLDLFSIFLPAALGSAASWATTKFLDVVAGCPSCGKETSKNLPNLSTSNLICASCQVGLNQYANATNSTVQNGRLMCANLSNPHWEDFREGGLFDRKRVKNWFLVDINTAGMQHHGMILRAKFQDWKTKRHLETNDILLNNPYERTSYQRQGWCVDLNRFARGATLVSEVKVLNLENEVLHSFAPVSHLTFG